MPSGPTGRAVTAEGHPRTIFKASRLGLTGTKRREVIV
jgi:hypothetical protein